MKWRGKLYKKVRVYINRDVDMYYLDIFREWWRKFGNEIINEFEEVLDAEKEIARGEALREAFIVISRDANIDSNDINISRALHHIKVLIAETEQEVEYETDPVWENREREQETQGGLDQ